MATRFDGKVALVTGGGSGIGAATAARLIKEGARVIVADVSGAQESVAEELGDAATPRRLDVSRLEDVLATEAWISETFGGLDILVNNAGVGGAPALIHEYSLSEFDKVIGVNVRGAFTVLQAGLRLMLASGGGAVVNTASIASYRATEQSSAYVVSRGAILMLTRTAAVEYATKGIRINAVAPGVTRTPIYDAAPPEVLEMLVAQVPQGRIGEATDIANAIVFLADDNETPHITGQCLVVDGGRFAS